MHHISKNWEHVFDFQYKVVTGQCALGKILFLFMYAKSNKLVLLTDPSQKYQSETHL